MFVRDEAQIEVKSIIYPQRKTPRLMIAVLGVVDQGAMRYAISADSRTR
jgi:hypothetical protein